MSTREEALEALLGAHTFPGPFRFRVIGHSDPALIAEVLAVATAVTGVRVAPTPDVRPSAKGNYQSVVFTLTIDSAERVLEVYEALRRVSGVKYCL